jgi:peptidoglycan/LPS O-acetylase OafA/YrhL
LQAFLRQQEHCVEYRPEIDGLRALAVVPVILFHAGFQTFSGGFVGVDVFFVISGYLITSIILAEKQAGTFAIVNFYERRARRILPALFVVLSACLPFAWMWLLPTDMKNFSQSLVAVSAFTSNILFWIRSGYFESNAELLPLLHTWSLAVEEQYYVFFPIFLILAWRLGKRWVVLMLASVAVVSLAAAQWGSARMPAAAFYLLPTRGWELLIGALIAFYVAGPNKPNPRLSVSQSGSAAGLLLIAYATFAFDKHTPFPGLYSLIPTLGAALIILFATRQTFSGKLLSSKPFVGVGLISYSAYLWHQPLFAFARHRSLDEPNKWLLPALAVAAMVLAYFSWKYVETPFRNKQRFNRKQIFAYGVVGSAVFVAFGLAGYLNNGFFSRKAPHHLPENYFTLAAATSFPVHGIDGKFCVSDTASICRISRVEGAQKILLVGDSHSADFSVEFRRLAAAKAVSASQFSVGGCGFIISQSERHNGECGKAIQLLRKSFHHERFDKIIFVGDFYNHTGKSNAPTLFNDLDSLSELISDMLGSGSEVILFTPRYSISSEPMRAALLNELDGIHVVKASSQSYVDERLKSFSALPNFKMFNERDYLIELGGADIANFNGHTLNLAPLYRDSNHLTNYGAKLVFDKFASTLAL